ncbi:MAG: hypothetical protein N2037_14425, partial [Acidimicrobiales bacterium]|nr:hypothetical protein [Acidimicrobiales bacterium]
MSSFSMSVRVGTIDGRIVAMKRAEGEDARARLRREARMLAVARLPGVVEVVALHDHEDEQAAFTELHTAYVSPVTLASHPPMPPPQVAALVAALAETVADLHQLGMVHGAIRPDHVLISADGWPVLCSFGSARLLSEDNSPYGATTEEEPPTGEKRTPADDVAAIGSLLDELLGTNADAEPIPDRRFSRTTSRGPYQRKVLRTIADRASATDPARRPTARSLAASIQAAVPNAQPGQPEAPFSRRSRIHAPRA